VPAERPKASYMSIGPNPLRFHSQNLYPLISRYGAVSSFCRGVTMSSSRAPVPVISLYVEPGGYCSAIAWLMSGRVGSLSSA